MFVPGLKVLDGIAAGSGDDGRPDGDTRSARAATDYTATGSFTGACTVSPRPGPASTPRSPSSTLMSASSSSWAVPNGTRSDAVESRVGLGGLVTVARVDQGALLSLSGEPLEAMLYLVGNPLVAREITSHNPGGALYAPFRAAVFRDLTGVHVAYDQPSTVFASLGSAAIDAIANELDLKIAAAARYACTMQP